MLDTTAYPPPLVNLRDHIARTIGAFLGEARYFDSPEASETLANIAISSISTYYPNGWEIVPEGGSVFPKLDVDAASRVEFFSVMVGETNSYTYGGDYRGSNFAIVDSLDGRTVEVNGHVFGPYGKTPDGALRAIRDVDSYIDIITAASA